MLKGSNIQGKPSIRSIAHEKKQEAIKREIERKIIHLKPKQTNKKTRMILWKTKLFDITKYKIFDKNETKINYNKIHLFLFNFLLITYTTCPKYLNYCIITVAFMILK